MQSWSIRSIILLAVLSGCDSGNDLAPVRGKVSFRGVPLKHGTIVFTPDQERGNGGQPSQAEINADGTYELHTCTPGAPLTGAAVGWHRVTITAIEPRPAHVSGSRFHVPRSLLPEKYCDPKLSGLACEVRAGRDNTIDFNLD